MWLTGAPLHDPKPGTFNSVSLDPPLILVCPGKSLSSFTIFEACEAFCVNVLSESQRDISTVFAVSKEDRFAQLAWREDARGCPVIEASAAHFSCASWDRIAAGDHMILIGRVEDFAASGAPGLGYANGAYFELNLERRAQEAVGAKSASVGAILAHDGKVLLRETPDGFALPSTPCDGRKGARSALQAFLREAGLPVALGHVYSIYDSRGGEVVTVFLANAKTAETAGLGRYVAIEEIEALKFKDSATQTMLRRYRTDCQVGVFGLYLGDDAEGEVHTFGEQVGP